MNIVAWTARKALRASLILASLVTSLASASVVIEGTRVIYPSNAPEVTIKLDNQSESPALVRTWIDRGDPKLQPDDVEVPFLLSPPVFRIDGKKGQTLRLIYTKEALPHDKESVFWLNVLEVPPKPMPVNGVEFNTLQFAVRSRIKLFFRPETLTSNPSEAPEAVTWKIVPGSDKGTWALQLKNPTPYHITFTHIGFSAGTFKAESEGGMLGPKAAMTLPLKGMPDLIPQSMEAQYTTINDFGAAISKKNAQILH